MHHTTEPLSMTLAASAPPERLLSVVVIGLNEAACLVAALRSVFATVPPGWRLEVFYVDSGSRDNSVALALGVEGVEVIHLNDPAPSAAKARNKGIGLARGEYIQLVDGDSILQRGWLEGAIRLLDADSSVACTFGHCVESNGQRSVYMRVCGLDWHVPPGDRRYSGGNAMWRRPVLQGSGGFNPALPVGEEPDLCYRVRQQGWRIVCIDAPMVKHDLGMYTFAQYWRRAVNSGKAYALVASRYWLNREKFWLYELLRNFAEPLLWIVVMSAGFRVGGLPIGIAALMAWWSLRVLRIAIKVRRRAGTLADAILYGLHIQAIRIPMLIGQLTALLRVR